MTITIPGYVIPLFLTAIMVAQMLKKGSTRRTWYDFEPIFSLFWIVPIMGVWIVYLAVLLWTKP